MSRAGAKAYLLLLFCGLVCASCQAAQFRRSPTDGGWTWKWSHLSRHPGAQNGEHVASFGLNPYASTPGMKASAANASLFNVFDFGAKGDGVTDNVGPFQNALNAAGAGGIVFVPSGQYAFKTNTTITVPRGVTLQGTYRTVPSHQVEHSEEKVDGGSILLAYAGEGGERGCFIQLSEDSTITGFSIYYPNQDPKQVPKAYPWSVCMDDNAAVTDLECLNCWNAINVVSAQRHYIARVQGQPINTGVFVYDIDDPGRIENVHFSSSYSADEKFISWQLRHGRSFVFNNTGSEYVFNTFSGSYAIGYHFVGGSGYFLGIVASGSVNASVQVDSAYSGILITDGEFSAYVIQGIGPQDADPTPVLVKSRFYHGSVSFVNSAFGGPASNHVAILNGAGTTSFSDCIFREWDKDANSYHAIVADENASGNLVVKGCEFQQDAPQVYLGSSLKKAVIMGNTFAGKTRISGNASNTQIGLNADDTPKYTCC